MQTNIAEKYRNTAIGQEADSILRSCVHCGFCTAHCPTYQLLGHEPDSPRGRIYLIKRILEGETPGDSTRLHLDRCLTCRACESVCPSGVRYGRLAEIGRDLLEQQTKRPLLDRVKRYLIRAIIPHPARMKPLLQLGQLLRPIAPGALKRHIPLKQKTIARPTRQHTKQFLLLEGCVQSLATPNTNAATARVLDKLGIQVIPAPNTSCCGAVSHHSGDQRQGLETIRNNIDAWWPLLQENIDGILFTASGCGAHIKEYGELLQHDPDYADKARLISERAHDLSQIVASAPLASFANTGNGQLIAFHAPCTLQHALGINGSVEHILQNAGYQLTPVANAHLCCGSAGTYSLLQPQISSQLLTRKLDALLEQQPSLIATANIGCQMHLASRASVPVVHWIELLDHPSR